jgi:hypothetical protein
VTPGVTDYGTAAAALLEANVDGVQLIEPLYERSVWSSPADVSRELAVQHVRVASIVPCLQS